ncbi:22929_t:CDS:1, partial [Gigaspora rosea]
SSPILFGARKCIITKKPERAGQPLRVIKKDQIELILQAMHEHPDASHFGERTT